MSVTLRCIACLLVASFGQLVVAADKLLTGLKFRQELEKPVSVVFTKTDLLYTINELAANQQIAIILDRRQDSSAELTVDARNVTLQTALTRVTGSANCDLAVIDNIVYCGPKFATSRLRTLVELRKADLAHKPPGMSEKRKTELQHRQSFSWTDLQPPREIIDAATNSLEVKVTNLDLIPYDLWAAKTLPDTTLVEALTVLLNQFDLTFQWREGGSSIDLVPIPDKVFVERKIHPKQKLSEAVDLVQQQYPDLVVKTVNTDVLVRGRLEECEAVEELLRGKKPAKNQNEPQDLRKQRTTLRTPVAVPLSLVIKKLEESNIRFEYDPEEMKDHGVDMEQLVNIDVTNVTTEEFFKTLFGPAKIDFQIQQMTVKLTPKKRK